MNSEQIKDMHLLYNAVYDEELREQFEEYNNTIYDEDIVEVATEYFYSYGLNEDGIDILIEKVGLESFVEYVYDLSEDLYVLTEARRAKKRTGGKSYDDVMAGINEREAKAKAKKEAKKNASEAASEKKEVERKEPESRGAESEAKAEQPKSKKPIRDAIARQILAGMKRHREATQTAGNIARETGKTLGKIASVTHEAGRRAGEHVKKHGLKSLAHEEVEAWVNQLVEEGYDLSEYTWDEMAEIYESSFDAGEDLYDIILSHLLDEGYVESVEQAEVIMVNMSEEWKQDIVERKHPIMSVTSPTGEKRSKKRPGATVDSDYHEHENPDEIETRRFSQQLSDRKKNRESKMAAGRLTVATKRGIEKATNRSERTTGHTPNSNLQPHERDDSFSNRNARRRRASGR